MKEEKSRENVQSNYKGMMECGTVAVNLPAHYLHVKLTAALIIT